MKAPQFIQKIAAKHGNTDEVIRHLMEVRRALLSGNLYMRVVSVNRMGTSRKVVIKYLYRGKMYNVFNYVYLLAGCNSNQVISGGGMDMLFQCQYNLFLKLCPRHKYQVSMPPYRDL